MHGILRARDRSRTQPQTLVVLGQYHYALGRSIPLVLLDANGHTGLRMAQPKEWLGPRFPQRENFDGGQLRLSLEKRSMTAINIDERFCCGPSHSGPPLCARARVDYICAPQAIQLQVRDVRVFLIVGIKTATRGGSRSSRPLVSGNGTGHHTSLSSNPGCSASVGQGDTGWSRSSTTPHRRGMLESIGRCYSSCRTVFLQVTRKRLERPEDTAAAFQSMLQAHKAVVHSPVDLLALRGICRAGFSSQHLPALIVLWRDLSAFWAARRKLDVPTRGDQ